MTRTTLRMVAVLMGFIIANVAFTASGQGTAAKEVKRGRRAPAFSYDKAVLPNAKPWTAKKFRNSPRNFQFAIIGDRTGGANVEGTFKLAMQQINLLQPEFVINVGDVIEAGGTAIGIGAGAVVAVFGTGGRQASGDRDAILVVADWRTYNSRNPEEKDGSAELLYSFNDLNAEKNKQFSQEFRFNGEIGPRFRWTAGVNYFWEHAKQNSGITLSTPTLDKLVAEREIGAPYDIFEPGQPLDFFEGVCIEDIPLFYLDHQGDLIGTAEYASHRFVQGNIGMI